MSPDTEQAIRMLDSFGARYFELTVNDLKGEKIATATTPHCTGLRANIAAILTEASERQQNVIIRPRGAFVQLNDLADLGPVLPHTGPVTAKLCVLATGQRRFAPAFGKLAGCRFG